MAGVEALLQLKADLSRQEQELTERAHSDKLRAIEALRAEQSLELERQVGKLQAEGAKQLAQKLEQKEEELKREAGELEARLSAEAEAAREKAELKAASKLAESNRSWAAQLAVLALASGQAQEEASERELELRAQLEQETRELGLKAEALEAEASELARAVSVRELEAKTAKDASGPAAAKINGAQLNPYQIFEERAATK